MFPAHPPLAVLADVASSASPPLFLEVDPVLVGIIAVLLFIVFMFFLLLRRTLMSFSEGMREGKRR